MSFSFFSLYPVPVTPFQTATCICYLLGSPEVGNRTRNTVYSLIEE